MLKITDLQKSFGEFQALRHLNLEIARGELFGFVGPNGAGKTTTMKIIAGLMMPDGGEVMIDGVNALPDSRRLKKKIGYMPDFFGVYDNLKTYEYMEFYAGMYGISGREARLLCGQLLELVHLSDKADSYVDSLSRGMKQRLCLARSLVHNPEFLILDEPASGLDPRARFEMKEILKNLRSMGKTLLISSHILPELAEICSSIGIIEHGSMTACGTMEEIQNTLKRSNPVMLRLASADDLSAAIRLLKENPEVSRLSVENTTISFTLNKTGNTELLEASVLSSLVLSGISVSSFYREKNSLESLFMQLTEKTEDAPEVFS
jgi:ABC-2 type transport system ATP-binding protein